MNITKGTRRYILRIAAGALCLVMALGMMPARAFADLSEAEKAQLANKTSAELKVLMDSAKADFDKYTAQYKKDDQAVTNAANAMNSAYNQIQPKKAAMDTAELPLDRKCREFVDDLVVKTWNSFDRSHFNASNTTAVNIKAKYRDKGMTYDNAYQFYLSSYRIHEVKGIASLNTIITNFENKYGAGTFDEVFTRALGYNSIMDAMDHIDTCNRIRADRTELAKYWVDVKHESVPNNMNQLGVSPSMLVTSAMSTALISCDTKTDHIYVRGGFGMQNAAQNAHSMKKDGDFRITDAFAFLWSHENSAGITAHNGNIAAPGYNVTGAALSNPNPYSHKAVFNQDFGSIDPVFKTYTTGEIRSKCKTYCRTELNAYNTAKTAYDNACAAYQSARNTYNSAVQTRTNTSSLKKDASERYKTYKYYYELKLKAEQPPVVNKYEVYFIDDFTGKTIKVETVVKGGAATPPAPPAHAGYKFIGWDRETYKNVNDVMVVIALYSECGENGGSDASSADKAASAESGKKDKDKTGDKSGSSDTKTGGSALCLKGKAKSKTSIKVTWKKLPKADKYIVYGKKCGKVSKYRKLKMVKGTSYTHKKLRKGTKYKYFVKAVRSGKAIAKSKAICVRTKE